MFLEKKVGPVCLPLNDEKLNKCYVTGWGRTTMKGDDRKFANALQKAYVSYFFDVVILVDKRLNPTRI